MMQKLARRLPWPRRLSRPTPPQARIKANGAAAADGDGFAALSGIGGGWNRTEYGEYYASSTPVYSAILADELAALRYGYDSRGRIKMESKDDMRQRGLPSPDKADALMLAFLSPASRLRLWT